MTSAHSPPPPPPPPRPPPSSALRSPLSTYHVQILGSCHIMHKLNRSQIKRVHCRHSLHRKPVHLVADIVRDCGRDWKMYSVDGGGEDARKGRRLYQTGAEVSLGCNVPVVTHVAYRRIGRLGTAHHNYNAMRAVGSIRFVLYSLVPFFTFSVVCEPMKRAVGAAYACSCISQASVRSCKASV